MSDAKDLNELTVRELQEMAVSAGLPESAAKSFTVKAPLIATINALQEKQQQVEEANLKAEVSNAPTNPDGAETPVQKVATIEERPDPTEEKQIERAHETKRSRMADLLDSQPKVRFMFQLEPNEKVGVVRTVIKKGIKEYIYVSGAVETCILNGYQTIWPKGVMIEDMPQQVADTFAESMRMTSQAGANIAIDRLDPETGKPVSEQL